MLTVALNAGSVTFHLYWPNNTSIASVSMSTQALAFFVIAYRQKKDLLCNNYIASNRTFSTILNGV